MCDKSKRSVIARATIALKEDEEEKKQQRCKSEEKNCWWNREKLGPFKLDLMSSSSFRHTHSDVRRVSCEWIKAFYLTKFYANKNFTIYFQLFTLQLSELGKPNDTHIDGMFALFSFSLFLFWVSKRNRICCTKYANH